MNRIDPKILEFYLNNDQNLNIINKYYLDNLSCYNRFLTKSGSLDLVDNNNSQQQNVDNIVNSNELCEQLYSTHINDVLLHLNEHSLPTPIWTKEIEELVTHMYNKMYKSFLRHKPAHRRNFLNRSYFLNKIFKILNMESHAKCFRLLSNVQKLKEHDDIWKNICKDMQWPFHPSL